MPRHGDRVLGWRKRLLFSLLPLLMVALPVEVGARGVYYEQHADAPLALVGLFRSAIEQRDAARIAAAAERLAAERDARAAAVPEAEPGSPFVARYEELFARFVAACRDADARLLVLYVPGPNAIHPVMPALCRRLCEEHGVPLLDITPTLAQLPMDVVFLLPEDGHLSRAGNAVLAATLREALTPLLEHRAGVSHAERPGLLGDLKPSCGEMFWKGAPLPCRLVTNAQGLRRQEEIAFPKSERARVLCVGDSFTFGHAMHNPHCYPQILERRSPELEVINAGIAGYTICDELSCFEERGCFTEPDVVVLQVMANDLDGLLPDWQAVFCRGGRYCPAKGERR